MWKKTLLAFRFIISGWTLNCTCSSTAATLTPPLWLSALGSNAQGSIYSWHYRVFLHPTYLVDPSTQLPREHKYILYSFELSASDCRLSKIQRVLPSVHSLIRDIDSAYCQPGTVRSVGKENSNNVLLGINELNVIIQWPICIIRSSPGITILCTYYCQEVNFKFTTSLSWYVTSTHHTSRGNRWTFQRHWHVLHTILSHSRGCQSACTILR